jgi:hypothetical protein
MNIGPSEEAGYYLTGVMMDNVVSNPKSSDFPQLLHTSNKFYIWQ